ncbi:hypothetical protein [Celeribacter sp.]|uniref:hypothetical protein n=1 Tax=Celeribacter sp. TaxID=1890673 RepID=UPI003A95321B
MSRSFFRKTAFALAISFTPALCVAQDVFGTLTATIDGAERTWFLTSDNGQSQSHGLTISVANMQSFNLWGQPTEDTIAETKDSLLLGFGVMTVGGNTIPLNASLTYLADGWASGWLANEEEQTVLTLTTLEEVEGGLLVEGRFASTTHYSDNLVSSQVDPSQAKQIDGHFSATLPEALLKDQ